MPSLKPIQRTILQALHELGGAGTAREIATRTCLSVNGVVQSLNNALDPRGYVDQDSDYAGGDTRWKLVDPPPDAVEKKELGPSPQYRMEGL